MAINQVNTPVMRTVGQLQTVHFGREQRVMEGVVTCW